MSAFFHNILYFIFMHVCVLKFPYVYTQAHGYTHIVAAKLLKIFRLCKFFRQKSRKIFIFKQKVPYFLSLLRSNRREVAMSGIDAEL